MTLKKYSRNQRFDDYDGRPPKPKAKDRTEKRMRNALRAQNYEEIISNRYDYDDMIDDSEYFDDDRR